MDFETVDRLSEALDQEADLRPKDQRLGQLIVNAVISNNKEELEAIEDKKERLARIEQLIFYTPDQELVDAIDSFAEELVREAYGQQ